MTSLLLKRASASRPSGEWNDDDFDLLCDGIVVGRIMKAAAVPVAFHGCGRWPSDTMRTARRRTAMRLRARLRWLPSRKAGDENRYSPPFRNRARCRSEHASAPKFGLTSPTYTQAGCRRARRAHFAPSGAPLAQTKPASTSSSAQRTMSVPVTTRTAGGGPGSPFGPAEPGGPAGPAGPCAPGGPRSPLGPAGPCPPA
jgi:hypothetical protein